MEIYFDLTYLLYCNVKDAPPAKAPKILHDLHNLHAVSAVAGFEINSARDPTIHFCQKFFVKNLLRFF